MQKLLSEKTELEVAIERFKKQKGMTENLVLSQTFLSRKNMRSGESDYGQIFANSNLDFIEGPETKQLQLLKEKGIRDWKSLANTNAGLIAEWLSDAGMPAENQTIADWQQQVTWAITGNWSALQQFQEEQLDKSGRSKTQMEAALIALLGFSDETSDLTIFEGIDREIQGILNVLGITNWTQLEAFEPELITKTLIANNINSDPNSWSKQARLAIEGKWMELSRYQDQLHGSHNPE